MIVLIDNYDSFTHNLARHMALAGWECEIVRNDALSVEDVTSINPEAIIFSPGPGVPADAGISLDLIKKLGPSTPMLGVCLGHQSIGQAYGAKIIHAKPMHGQSSKIRHNGDPLFAGIPEIFDGGRYHSLKIERKGHEPLEVIARTQEGDIMAIRHARYPVYGTQFHPESVLTPHGMDIVRNFTGIALRWHADNAPLAA